jgi:uncharacterized membrane protein
MDRTTKMAIVIVVVVVLLVLMLASYGYWSGAWVTEP